ncbi:MAG: hypothetical protein IJB43_11525 [Clostridia bacterium]|nr:hypothetical protein [Clostridia bacterium]
MDSNYYEVKPNKLTVKLEIFALTTAIAVIILLRHWSALIIPILFLVLSIFHNKTDRILYNDKEVIIFAPNGKRFRYSWKQIESAEIVLETVHGRSSKHPRWFLKIRYSYNVKGKNKTETLKKFYYLYDGAFEFVEFFKTVKEKEQQ